MARMPRPWRRRHSDGAWFAQINGKRVRLAESVESYETACKALAHILAGVGDSPGVTVDDVVAAFLANVAGRVTRGELATETGALYARRLRDFTGKYGHLEAKALRPAHVLEYMDARATWGPTIRSTVVAVVKVCFGWAHRNGVLESNPIATMPKPRARRSLEIPDHATVTKAMRACPAPFSLFLRVLFETGCRRSEAMRLEARDIDFSRGLWSRAGKSTWATGKPRVVHIPPALLEKLREQAERYPDGPLLRHSRGGGWSAAALSSALRKVKREIGADNLTLRSLRHLFATDGLANGVPVATVAELLGHTTPAMIAAHYSHLSDRTGHMKAALDQIRPQAADIEHQSQPSGQPAPPPASDVAPPPSPAPARKPPRRRRGRG